MTDHHGHRPRTRTDTESTVPDFDPTAGLWREFLSRPYNVVVLACAALALVVLAVRVL